MKTYNAHLGIRKEIRELTFSPIREIVRFAENQDEVVPFWFGEPDVSTPDFISRAAKEALDNGDTFYAPNPCLLYTSPSPRDLP